jgi:hypothetical protein
MSAYPRNVKNQRLDSCLMQAVTARRRGRPHWRGGAIAALLWLLLAPCLPAAIEDRREAIAQQSQRYRAQHFPDGHMPPKHSGRQLSSVPSAVAGSNAAPGGVGYGYYFYNTALLWTNCSIADYYVDAPASLGGNVVSNLYLTSTCRAQLGTESLISYQLTIGPQFWIYDWSQAAAGNPWQVMIDLPTDNPQYLTLRPDEFAITRQMVHVRNGTYYLGSSNSLYNWQNQTLLFDFVRGNWDYVYSYNYTTTNLTDNIPVTNGESVGFWGPIIETFPPYTNINPVGFDLIRLFQDGKANPSWLTPATSYSEYNFNATNWSLLTQATNTSFTASYSSNSQVGGQYNMGSLCVTANTSAASFSLNPPAGLISPYWIITPNSNRWDNTVVGLPPGAYTITFSNASGLATPAGQSFTIATNCITTVQAVYGLPLPPVLQSVTLLGQTMTCIWNVQSNFTYQAQTTTNLTQTNWSNLGNHMTATNGTVTTTNSTSANPQAFFRLALIP